MPDEIIEPPAGPDFPAQPTETTPAAPAANEPADTQPGLFGKIRDSITGVAEKHGLQFKRGRGRPRKDGQPAALDKLVNPATGQSIPAAGAPALTAAVPAPEPTVSQAVFHRSIIGGAKGLLKTLAAYVRNLAAKAGMESAWISRNMAAAEPDPDALADWSESLKTVLEKYNVNTQHAPEIALAINTGRLLAPYAVMIVELRKEINRRKELEANQPGRTEPTK